MVTDKIPAVHRNQVLAFRLGNHNLAVRLPSGSLFRAAGACGVQNTPPGSAALALHARLTGITPEAIDKALAAEKTLLQVMSLRGAPYIVPTADTAVFTLGALSEDEESLRAFIQGARPALDMLGMSAMEVVDHAESAILIVLDDRELNKDQLGIELAELVEQELPSEKLHAWRSPSWYAARQSLGESIVRFALYILGLKGVFCYAPRQGGAATFIRTDRWLGAPLPKVSRTQAQAELARRYLHCYGPSTAGHLAEWAGIAPAQAARIWDLITSELAAIDFEGQKTWLLDSDLSGLMEPPIPEGVRILPPHDPYLLLRDRATLIPDRKLQRLIWRSSGNPGAVLASGRFVATWRPRKKGRRLNLAVECFESISPAARAEIEAEAETIAPFRDCVSVEVEFKEG